MTVTDRIPHPLDAREPLERLPFFVYGTLRPGHGNSRLWIGDAEDRYDGVATVDGFTMTAHGCPYITPDVTQRVVGTLIVAHDTLDERDYRLLTYRLDMLEGINHDNQYYGHYRRRSVVVNTPDGDVTAWVYWTDTPATFPVPGNDWNNYQRQWARR